MSSSSSTFGSPQALLHLVEHVGEGSLELERLPDFLATHVGMRTEFEEARVVVVAEELDGSRGIRPPVGGPALEVLKDRREASLGEESHGILRVLVEVGVEDALI